MGAAVAVSLGAGGMMVANASSSAPSSFVSVEPTRVLDTRFDVGLSGPFVSGVAQKLQITGVVPTQPPNGVPSVDVEVVPANATAVVLNVTAVGPSSGGFVSIRPGDATGTPATSNINFGSGGPPIANGVTVALPTSGSLDLFVSGTINELLIDVAGFYVPAGSGGATAFSREASSFRAGAISPKLIGLNGTSCTEGGAIRTPCNLVDDVKVPAGNYFVSAKLAATASSENMLRTLDCEIRHAPTGSSSLPSPLAESLDYAFVDTFEDELENVGLQGLIEVTEPTTIRFECSASTNATHSADAMYNIEAVKLSVIELGSVEI